jgi:hypothetical protein
MQNDLPNRSAITAYPRLLRLLQWKPGERPLPSPSLFSLHSWTTKRLIFVIKVFCEIFPNVNAIGADHVFIDDGEQLSETIENLMGRRYLQH